LHQYRVRVQISHRKSCGGSTQTVSEVDLNALRVIATLTVGGHPTALQTASDGSVWVGGNGYISKISSAFSILGSYSTYGKAVLSLAVGNAIGEIAVTSADANGNVFIYTQVQKMRTLAIN
jgi:hypothetical protein